MTYAYPLPTRLQRMEFLAIQAAVFMAPYPAIRHATVFITASDYLFLAAIILRLGCGIPVAPLGAVTGVWLASAAALTGGLLVASLAYGDPVRGLVVDAQYMFAYIVLPYALLGRSDAATTRLIKCFVIGMIVMCVIGIAVYLTGYNGGHSRHLAIVTGGNRLAGFVDNANGMAGYIVLTLPLLWSLWQTREIARKFAFIALAILLAALVLTSSNTGIIGLVVVTVVLLAGRRNFLALAVAGILAAAVITWGQPYLPHTFRQRVLTAIVNEDVTQAGTYESRRDLMIEAWKIAKDHNWIGIGADQYRVISEFHLPVHNTYQLLWIEGGLISLLGFLGLLICIIAVPIVQRGKAGMDIVALATFGTTVVFAGMAMGYTHVYARSLILPMLLALSPAVALIQLPRPSVSRRPSNAVNLSPT